MSDHQPLKHLFGHARAIPPMASARIQRWALTLSAYSYHIEFKPGSQHSNADGLSRLPLPDIPKQVPLPGEVVLLMESLQTLPVTSTQVAKWTDHDPTLAKVRDNVQRGWLTCIPYQRRKDELSVEDGCVLWGRRVPQGQAKALEMVHEGHPRASRMKSLVWSFMWWPGMDGDVEDKVRACTRCQAQRKSPAPALLHPWDWLQRPWSRLHADYAGPFQGKMFLVARSKWLTVKVTQHCYICNHH